MRIEVEVRIEDLLLYFFVISFISKDLGVVILIFLIMIWVVLDSVNYQEDLGVFGLHSFRLVYLLSVYLQDRGCRRGGAGEKVWVGIFYPPLTPSYQ